MSTPFYNSDWLVLQAALEVLTTSANWTALVTAQNDRWETMDIAAPAAPHVEVMVSEDDAETAPQGSPCIRLDVLEEQELIRGVNGPEARSAFLLEVRCLVRTTDLPDATKNAAAAGKGWISTGAQMRLRNFGQTVMWLLQNKLIAATVADPDGGSPIASGIYNVVSPRKGRVDRPVPGDKSLLRLTMTVGVHARTRNGVSRWDATN